MKSILATSILSSCLLFSSFSIAADINPVVVAVGGSVKSAGAPVSAKQTVSVGSSLETGRGGNATVSLAPGLGMALESKTTVQILEASAGKGGSSAVVELVDGKVYCSLKKESKGRSRFRLNMGGGEYVEAVGTAWTAERSEGRKVIVVTSGTVTWKSASGALVTVQPGSVLLATYNGEGVLTSLVVVNLVDGTATTYPMDGGEPVTVPATPEQLAEARAELEESVGGLQNLDPETRAALLSLLFEVNKTLGQAGLGSISAPQQQQNGGSSNNPADTVSGTSPS